MITNGLLSQREILGRVRSSTHGARRRFSGSRRVLTLAHPGLSWYSPNMQSTKERVRALLDRLPDDCSFDDVLYHLYVHQKVEAGLVDAAEGKLIPHEQVAEELRRKWVKGAGQ